MKQPFHPRPARSGPRLPVGCDYAGSSASSMPPSHSQEFILPGLTACGRAAHEAGAYTFKHSNSRILSIIDTDMDGLNPLEPAAYARDATGRDAGARLPAVIEARRASREYPEA